MSTHWDGCWTMHRECAEQAPPIPAVAVLQVLREIDSWALRDGVTPGCVVTRMYRLFCEVGGSS